MRYLKFILSIAASLLAIVAWLSGRGSGAPMLTAYDIFPLFGLVAFSLMWAQVVASAIARFRGIKLERNKHIDAFISGLILVLIVFHPVVLWIALYIDGAGLPPMSYLSTYGVNTAAIVALLFGSVSLTIFLSYELRRWFSHKPWWKVILWLQSLALILIFIHALVLGQEAGHSWFTALWVVYGITLVAAMIYNYVQNKRRGTA